MSFYEISVFVHVSAAVVGLGATFAVALLFPVAQQLDVRHLPYVHQFSVAVYQRLATPGLAVLLITGIYQTADGPYGFDEPWISGTFLILIVLGGLTGGYFTPTDRRLGALVAKDLDGGGQPSEEYQRRARTLGMVGALAGVLVLAALFLMVIKPGA